MLRSLLFVIWLYGTMGLLGLACLPLMLLPRRACMLAIRTYAHLVLFGLRWIVGVRVEIRGHEHIPEGPVLVAGKHQAMLDVFLPFVMFKDPIIIMKRELLWYPVLGWYALRTGMIPIDRDGTSRTLKLMLRLAQRRVKIGGGRQMVIFPEGTRVAPGADPVYKPAGLRAFYKALDVPLLPVATNSGQCWPAHGLRRRSGRVVYQVLDPIPPGLDHKTMLARLVDELETASTALLAENPS